MELKKAYPESSSETLSLSEFSRSKWIKNLKTPAFC
jgi:hypothetical protein